MAWVPFVARSQTGVNRSAMVCTGSRSFIILCASVFNASRSARRSAARCASSGRIRVLGGFWTDCRSNNTDRPESRTAMSSRDNAFHVEFKQSVLTLFPRERRLVSLERIAGATGIWLSRSPAVSESLSCDLNGFVRDRRRRAPCAPRRRMTLWLSLIDHFNSQSR